MVIIVDITHNKYGHQPFVDFFEELLNVDRLSGYIDRIKNYDVKNLVTDVAVYKTHSVSVTKQELEIVLVIDGVCSILLSKQSEHTEASVSIEIRNRVGEFNGSWEEFINYILIIQVHPTISLLLRQYLLDYREFVQIHTNYVTARRAKIKTKNKMKKKYGDECIPQ